MSQLIVFLEMELAEIGLKGETKDIKRHEEYYPESRINEEKTNDQFTSQEKVVFQCHYGTVCRHHLQYTNQNDQNRIYISMRYFNNNV